MGLGSSSAFAEMYKWLDENGNINYSDVKPHQGVKPLEAPALTSIPPTKVPKKKPKNAQKSPFDANSKPTKYTSLKISSPANEATIRDNNGNIKVSIAITPALNVKQGHYLKVSIDGVMLPKKLSTSSVNFKDIDRGTHVIRALVKNKKGKVLRKSKAVTVYLHRFSRLINPPKKNLNTGP